MSDGYHYPDNTKPGCTGDVYALQSSAVDEDYDYNDDDEEKEVSFTLRHSLDFPREWRFQTIMTECKIPVLYPGSRVQISLFDGIRSFPQSF